MCVCVCSWSVLSTGCGLRVINTKNHFILTCYTHHTHTHTYIHTHTHTHTHIHTQREEYAHMDALTAFSHQERALTEDN